jgi:hypothetical protein
MPVTRHQAALPNVAQAALAASPLGAVRHSTDQVTVTLCEADRHWLAQHMQSVVDGWGSAAMRRHAERVLWALGEALPEASR